MRASSLGILGLAVGGMLTLAAVQPAEAYVGVTVGIGGGGCCYYGHGYRGYYNAYPGYYDYPGYYPGYYYAPPPVVYAPPPVVYQSAPVVVQQAAPVAAPGTYLDSQGRTCRQYTAAGQAASGSTQATSTACLMPDGTWQMFPEQ